MVSVTTRLQRREEAKTLALSIEIIGYGGS